MHISRTMVNTNGKVIEKSRYNSKGALKPRVETATKRVHTWVVKLDTMLTKLKTRDNEIFQQIILLHNNMIQAVQKC